MERNNIVEKKAVRRPRRVLEYWRGLILNLKTNMNFGTAPQRAAVNHQRRTWALFRAHHAYLS